MNLPHQPHTVGSVITAKLNISAQRILQAGFLGLAMGSEAVSTGPAHLLDSEQRASAAPAT